MPTTTINTAPATPTAPARVVPTANQPVRVAWGDWLEQLLVHETPLIESAAQAGLSVGAALIPGGIGSAALNLLGPTVVKQAVDGVINMLQGPLTSAGAALEVPASNTIATMAANVLNSTLPTFVSKAGASLDSWLQAAVAKL